MSWYVLVDGNNVLARSGIADPSVLIGSPEVKTELNKAGSFQFEIYPPHPYYDQLIKMKTKIDVVLNGELIFSGRVLYTQTEMDKKRKVYCEGCLAYLLDSIQESYEYDSRITQFYDMTVHEFLDRLLARHDKMFVTDKMGVLDNFQNALTAIGITEGNTDTTERLKKALDYYDPKSTNKSVFGIDDNTKLFKLGTVNAEGTADRFKFEIKGHSKTLDMILETLVDSVGGFIQAYRDPDDGWYVLDWKDKFGNENMQPIEWGTNLIELQQDESGVETFTRLYPVGKSSTNSNSTGSDKNITLRETRMYFPVPEAAIVYDDDQDEHEAGTEITNPKTAGFYEKDANDKYVATQDTEAIRGKQYYMPIFGNPLMLKVDDILNYSQVYMGDFTAVGVMMDALALNGNVDLSNRPRVSVADMRTAGYTEFSDEDYVTLYPMPYGDSSRAILLTPIDQNGVIKTKTDLDDYAETLLDGGFDTIKNRDTEHLLIHAVQAPDTQSRQTSLNDIANKAVEYSDRWEELVDRYFPNGATPVSLEYYEVQQYGYVLTTDTKPVRNKNYYTLRPEETRSRLEEKYGVIVRSVDFSDVNGINDEAKQLALYKRAVEYIHKTCTDLPEQITLTAIDLRNLDTSIEQMKIGCDIHIKSKPHAIDRHMKCISIDYYLNSPEKNNYVISSKPTGSDAIPRFTEQAETKKKSGSKGSSESTGGTGGSFGGGGSSPEQTEEEIAVLKNHVFYTAGSEADATITGSYNQLFAKALGMLVDENGNPIFDTEGNWAWDNVTDASTPRNSIITKLDLRPSSGTLISEINTTYEVVLNPTGSPKQQGWYEYKERVEYRTTRDTEVIPDKDYYDLSKHRIANPSTAVYQAVTPAESDKPNEKGWYELNDGNYVATEDTEVVAGKNYYSKKSPKEMNWQEPQTEGNYELTADDSVNDAKRYYVRHAGGNETIASSRVEVHPSQVIINSVNNAFYNKVENPSGNPKTHKWYEKDDNGNYRRTDDVSVQTGKEYYELDPDAIGSVEIAPGDVLIEAINNNAANGVIGSGRVQVQPGSVLIQAINQNDPSQTHIRLEAAQIILDGEAVADSLASEALTVDSIDVAGEASIDNEGYADFAGLTLAGADIEPQAIITGIKVVSTGTNQYKLQAEYADNPGTWVDLPNSTFNRAATPSLSGGWSNGVYTVTSNPASSNPLSTKISNLSGSNNITSNGTYTYKVMYEDENEDDQETGYSSSIVVNVPSGSSPSISIKTRSSEDAGCGPRSVRPNSSDYTQIFSWVTTTDAKRYYAFAVVLSNGTKKYYYIDRNTLQS